MIRQGDVLLVPVKDQSMPMHPRPARIKSNGRIVLAIGETSAHEHTIAEDDAELVRQGERMLLTVFRDTKLAVTDTRTGQLLPRHTPLTVGGGLYEVRTQRELEVRTMTTRPAID